MVEMQWYMFWHGTLVYWIPIRTNMYFYTFILTALKNITASQIEEVLFRPNNTIKAS